jgi:hypothetical protein
MQQQQAEQAPAGSSCMLAQDDAAGVGGNSSLVSSQCYVEQLA